MQPIQETILHPNDTRKDLDDICAYTFNRHVHDDQGTHDRHCDTQILIKTGQPACKGAYLLLVLCITTQKMKYSSAYRGPQQ